MICIKLYRISNYFYKKKMKKLSKIVYWLNKVLSSCEIDPAATIGDINIYHSVGIVIGGNVVIEDGVTIMSGVVIGANGYFRDGINSISSNGYNKMPLIKEKAFLGANSCILGDIVVEKNAIVGANAVVIKNVPENHIAIGVPAVIK